MVMQQFQLNLVVVKVVLPFKDMLNVLHLFHFVVSCKIGFAPQASCHTQHQQIQTA